MEKLKLGELSAKEKSIILRRKELGRRIEKRELAEHRIQQESERILHEEEYA